MSPKQTKVRRRRSRVSNFAAGTLALVLGVIIVYLGFTKAIPFQHHYTLHAVFRTSNNINKGSPVRIGGVNVGKVTGVGKIDNDGGAAAARVTMRIESQGLPIHTDATATIRPRIFLEGNFFVDVKPGTPSAATISDGGTVPVQQTATPVQLDQILGALHADTRDDLKVVLANYAKGLSGPGAKGFNLSTPYWRQAYQRSAQVADALQGSDPSDLSGFFRGSSSVASALNQSPSQLQSLLVDFNTTAQTFASQQANLRAALAELPRTLDAGLPALAALDRSFPPTRGLVAALDPAVRSSGPAIDALIPFIFATRGLVSRPELRGLSADLRSTVPSLAGLQAANLPLQEQVRLAASCQDKVILPFTRDRISTDNTFLTPAGQPPAPGKPNPEPVYQDQAKLLPGLGGDSRSFDANGIYFRVLANTGNYFYNFGGNLFNTVLPIQGVNPPPPVARPPINADAPCETQAQPDLRTVEASAPPPMSVNTTSPRAQAATARANTQAVGFVRKMMRTQGLRIRVANQPLTPAQVRALHK